MNKFANTALFAAAGFLTLGTALAQSPAGSVKEIRATVPFDFTVGSKLLPPGNYEIVRVEPSVIRIRSTDKNISVVSMVSSDGQASTNGSRLVFDKCGDQYFLREVPLLASSMSVLPTSKIEKRAQDQEAALQTVSHVTIATK